MLASSQINQTKVVNLESQFLIPSAKQDFYLVGGKLQHWDGAVTNVKAPFQLGNRDLELGYYPELGPKEALEIVDSAYNAYDRGLGQWAQASPEARIQSIKNFVDSLLVDREEIVRMLMCETAKPLADSYKEFDRSIEYIEATIKAYRELIDQDSKPTVHKDGCTSYLSRNPIGVALCMAPSNYPLNETFTSLIPALLTGNTIVMKPAKIGVLLFNKILKSFQTNFPPGVVNTVYGDGQNVITPIMLSGKVSILAFIGSTNVAKVLSNQHPEPNQLVRILGLGAHNPAIILADTKIKDVLPEIIKGSLTFNGQRCTSLALHFVHESISTTYAEMLAASAEELKRGLPMEDGVQITSVMGGTSRINFLQDLITDAVSKGARIMNDHGGDVENNIMTPAVLYPVTKDMRIYSEEQFGPIVPIVKFSDSNTVIREIAESRFGQQLSIFGEDKNIISELALKARTLVARININSQSQRGPDELPFTGRKDAGLGVLSVSDALKAFTLPTVIYVKK